MNRHERRAARKSQAAPAGSNAADPSALHEAAVIHMRAGRLGEAQLCCQQLLARDPEHVDALQLAGLLALQAKRYDEAIEWIGRANRRVPDAGHLVSLGTALEQQGLHQYALKAYDAAAKQKPDDAEAWTRLANTFLRLQRRQEALASFEQLLKLRPRDWATAQNCAALLLEQKRYDECLIRLNLSLELQPDHAPTVQARAAILFRLERFEEALSESRRAKALDPDNADICFDIGSVLQKLDRDAEALAQFDRAIQLRPDFINALQSKALLLSALERFDEAVDAYQRMLAIDPDNAEAVWAISLIQLMRGDFKAGWEGREARWRIPSLPGTARYPKFSQPMWRGEQDIAGKTVLICADEGIGDTIQFVRYAPMLAALGARVLLLPQETLYPLLAEMPGVAQCLPNTRGLPSFDFHCPIMSLPLVFGTTLDTIPAEKSYLPAPSKARVQAFDDQLGAHDRLRVGLVWSGNPEQANDHNRSVQLATLSRLLTSDACFVSLQKDPRAADQATLRARTDIIDLTDQLTDFAATAALIGCLDLVITVDTSVAHLAAALGCPTWILLPAVPACWRWLLDRDDNPWYPTVRLFRSTLTRNREDVLDQMRIELDALVATYAKQPRP